MNAWVETTAPGTEVIGRIDFAAVGAAWPAILTGKEAATSRGYPPRRLRPMDVRPEAKASWISNTCRHFRNARIARKLPHQVHVRIDSLPFDEGSDWNAGQRANPLLTERVRLICQAYTPAVQTAGKYAFCLEFGGTGHLSSGYESTLRALQQEILERTGVTVTICAARTKTVAAIASRLEPCGGFRFIALGSEDSFLAAVSVGRLCCIRQGDARGLVERGVTTIGQLRLIPKPVLVAVFGSEVGGQLWRECRGLDPHQPRKFLSSHVTAALGVTKVPAL